MEQSKVSKPEASIYQSLPWAIKSIEWPEAWQRTASPAESKCTSLYEAQDRLNRNQIGK